MRSSTSSSECASASRSGLYGAVVLLLLVEVFVRAWRPDGTIPYALGEREYHTLQPELDAFGARQVSIVGDSRSREAILAPVLTRALQRVRPLEVGNYSVSAALAEDTSGVVARLLRAKPRPRLIVYGVTPRQLSASKVLTVPYAQYIWHLRDWWRSRSVRGESRDQYLPQTLRNELSDRLFLFRLRTELYEAAHAPVGVHDVAYHFRLIRLQTRRFPPTPMRGGLPPWKIRAPKDYWERLTKRGVRVYIGAENTEPEWPHTYQERFLDLLVTACREANVPLVLAEVPAAPALLAELPARAYPGFYEVFDRVSSEHGVPFIRVRDLGILFGERDFSEMSHMNYLGAEKYTNALATRLAPLIPP